MIPGSANPLLLRSAAATGYQIQRSLRFNSSDSAFCSRTFSSSGNRRTWTWAGWVKRSKLGEYVRLFNNTASGANAAIQFMDTDKLRLFDVGIGLDLQTTQVFRDASAWYHFVIVVDTTQATSSNRAKLYVNGSQITTFSTSTYPSQNTDGAINNNVAHQIGSLGGSSEFFNGYLADIHFIDGQALDPTSFTEVSATTGQLVPKQYTGSFGTNGFWLKFSDNSAATATTLGKDYSGNSNNWTPNNLSVTAGAGNDSLVDTPTSYGTDTGAGGEVRGNYATLNPINSVNSTLTNGNLDATISTGASTSIAVGSIAVTTGKWYWEVVSADTGEIRGLVGVCDVNASSRTYTSANGWGYWSFDGNKYTNSTGQAYGATWTNGDVIGVALDMDGNSLTFYKNGVSQGVAYSSVFTGKTISPALFNPAGASSRTYTINFGQRQWAYAAPAGFKALCDTNLPAPVVAKPSTVMDVLTWTGNGVNGRSITGLNFSPDFVWIKNRLNPSENSLFDTVRGAAKTLYSNQTAAELASSDFGHISSFDSAGFTLANGASGSYPNLATNWNGSPIVGWTWDAGSSTVTNTQGSITGGSQVRANASAGFSVVGWTSDGAASVKTLGLGLGVTPSFVVIKNRDLSANWTVYHSSLSNLTAGYLRLNTTDAMITRGTTLWGSFSSTVFGVDQSFLANANEKCVAYCFAPVAGYSAMGSYVGNGSSDGTFVYTGFRPRFVLIKRTDSTSQWAIKDSARDTYNVATQTLLPNLSNAEETNRNVDLLSNGFKWRGTDQDSNVNGGTFIYLAIAESPFQYARAR